MPQADKDKPGTTTGGGSGGGGSQTTKTTNTTSDNTSNRTGTPQRKITKQALYGQLSQAGYSFPFDISYALEDAIKNGGDDPFNYFYAKIIKDPRFKTAYPGIFGPGGRLRMTPGAYEQYADSAIALASKSGYKLTRAQIGNLVANGVSADELRFRITAADTVKANGALFASVNGMLRDAGLSPITTAQGFMDFMTGRSPKQVYDLYESASFQAGAKAAGIDITNAEARTLAFRTPAWMSLEDIEAGYATIAQQLKESGVDVDAFGLNLQDLQTIQFGGPNRAQLASKAAQALAQSKANAAADVGGEQAQMLRGRPVTGQRQEADTGIVPGTTGEIPFGLPPGEEERGATRQGGLPGTIHS